MYSDLQSKLSDDCKINAFYELWHMNECCDTNLFLYQFSGLKQILAREKVVIISYSVMDITPKKRTKILTLKEHCNKSNREIARIVGVNHTTVSRIIKRQKEKGTTSPQRRGNCGRKRSTTPRDDKVLLRESKKNPRLTLSSTFT